MVVFEFKNNVVFCVIFFKKLFIEKKFYVIKEIFNKFINSSLKIKNSIYYICVNLLV